jgi:hypothetical protein
MNDLRLRQIIEQEKRRSRGLSIALFFQILFLAFVIFLTSCTSQARTQTQTRTVGVQAGQEVNISTTSTTLASETSGVDVAAVVTAALQAWQGKILGALDAIKPQPLPSFPSVDQIASAVSTSMPQQGTDWGTAAGGGLATALGLFLAWQKSREKKTVELDRDKIYDEHIELCKKTPPESLKG